MEQVEFWIWEHAMKYGMSKVLERIHTKYEKSLIPNSWFTALFLQEIKNSWESSSKNSITYNEVNSLRQLLSSTYKHYKECITSILGIKNFVKFDLVLRATFLVLRSSKSDSVLVKKQAINKFFPAWNVLDWDRIKNSFYIKDDILHTEIEQFYSQLRNWLAHESSNKEIIKTFDTLMKQYFPVLIAFMRSIKLTILERIQAKNISVAVHLEFIQQFMAQSSLFDEASVLDLYDIFCKRKFNFLGSKFLHLKQSLLKGEPQGVLKSEMFSLPPELPSNNNTQLYPSCFQLHPSMPSFILLEFDNCYQKMSVNRSIPRTKSGTPFEPFWFSTSSLVDPKPDRLTVDEIQENGPNGTENVTPRKLSNNSRVKEATGLVAQSPRDDNSNTSREQLPSPIANKHDFVIHEQEESNPQSQKDGNELLVRETETKCHENRVFTCRRKSEPPKPCEVDKDAEASRLPKRPRYTSIGGFEAACSVQSRINPTELYNQTSVDEHSSYIRPIEQIPDRSSAGEEKIPRNVKAAIIAHVDLSSQPCSKRQRFPSVWKLVQELSGHSRQLQKLGEDNERGYLNSFLNRLSRYRRNTF